MLAFILGLSCPAQVSYVYVIDISVVVVESSSSKEHNVSKADNDDDVNGRQDHEAWPRPSFSRNHSNDIVQYDI